MVKLLNKVIAAFGSSRIMKNDVRFSDVELLSQKLGQAGWHGLVGGHQGMMAAFSQGITAGSGHVTGITRSEERRVGKECRQ